jgi:MFS family permease
MFCVAGQFVFAMGGLHNIFWLMLLGRVIFGFGGEVLQGSQSTIISNWFKPH